MLSGGLKVAWKLFPEGLMIGAMPLSISCTLKSRGKNRLHRPATRQCSISNSLSKDSKKGVDDGRSTRSNYTRSTISSCIRYSANGDRRPFR
ncbi:unnamed protein product [Heterobilharzia americana]|nr:unnamed protein product [Heterobilharzia americana]